MGTQNWSRHNPKEIKERKTKTQNAQKRGVQEMEKKYVNTMTFNYC